MAAWDERPLEIANLLNPAFCALLLRDAAAGYRQQAASGLPYSVTFLVLPIVLHRPTREALPRTINAIMHAWIQEHSARQVEIVDRVRMLVPYTREAIIFGIQHRALAIVENGALESAMLRATMSFPDRTDAMTCRHAAGLLGRWFGRTGDASQILAMWGLRP